MNGWQTRDPSQADLHEVRNATQLALAVDGQVPVWNEAEQRWDPGDAAVAVDDGGVEVVPAASRLNFGDGLTVTDDGSGQVTVVSEAGASVLVVYADTPPADPTEGTVFVSRRAKFFDQNGVEL